LTDAASTVGRLCRELVFVPAAWLLMQFVWVPTTRKLFTSLVTTYEFSASEASAKVTDINLIVCCLVLLLTPTFNRLATCWLVE